MTAPLVTICPAVWKQLMTQAAGHAREAGGLLVGRRVRGGGWHVLHEVAYTPEWATNERVSYSDLDVERVRVAAHEMYAPLEPVGEWHAHKYDVLKTETLMPQISDEDKRGIVVGDFELICSTFPYPDYMPKTSEFEIQRALGETVCRAEAWLRVNGDVKPCRVTVRRVT